MELREILDPIDQALAENKVFLDELSCEEDVYWDALDKMAKHGFYTDEEAQEKFVRWREERRLGTIAIREA